MQPTNVTNIHSAIAHIASAIATESTPEVSVSVGADIVSIDRLREALKTDGFIDSVFAKSEICYCESQPCPEQHYAARWAGKEAAIKAHPCDPGKLNTPDVIVKRHDTGVTFDIPDISEYQLESTSLSLSHDDKSNTALAVAVLLIAE